MSIKEIAINTIQELPDTASWGEVEEKNRFIAGVQKAMQSCDEGEGHNGLQLQSIRKSHW